MKKKITLLSLLVLLASNGLCFAQIESITNNDSDVAPVKVALAGELVKEAVKSGLYTLGNALLNKYVNPSTTYYTSTDTTTVQNTDTSSSTVDTTSKTDTTSTVDSTSTQDSTDTTQTTTDQTEQMIPVS